MEPSDPISSGAAALGVSLPPGASDRLRRFGALLRDRAVPLGLISAGDSDRILERHVLDSLRAVVALRPTDTSAYDLGTGAGLPGVVVAVAVPRLTVRLVEARRRRIGFLELAVGELELWNAEVVHGRIEELREPADVCFARALAPPAESWRLARPLLRPGGRLVYFAGGRAGLTVPPGVAGSEVVEMPVLESSGPLVIMAR